MTIEIKITNAGRAALVNAANTGTAPMTITQVGLSATAVVPSATATSLTGELKRVSTVGGDVVAADTIHLTMLDESEDVYSLRSFALYLNDGTLFGLYGQSTPIYDKAGAAFASLALDLTFGDINTALLTFGDTDFMLPSATTAQRGIVELATVAEAQAGIDALRALTPAGAKAAVLGWLLGLDGSGSGLDADLLDGQHGAWYADVPARLGYTPANRAGDTFAGQVLVAPATGNGILSVRSTGVVTAKLVAQSDGNVVFYRNAGAGDAALWGVNSQTGPFAFNVAITRGGNQVWDAGNDGAGSGLDADTLDGKDWLSGQDVAFGQVDSITPNSGTTGGLRLRGNATSGNAYFQITNAAASVQWGYWRYDGTGGAQWNGAKGLFVGSAPVWDASNDGAGSGLDADLLDGQHGAWYADVAGRLGYTPANRAGDTFSGQVMVAVPGGNGVLAARSTGVVTAKLVAQSDGYVVFYRNAGAGDAALWGVNSQTGPFGFNVPITRGGNVVWDAGNDGSGSGLDADTLDGKDWLGGQDVEFGVVMAGTPNSGTTGGLRLRGNATSGNAYFQILSHDLGAQWGYWKYDGTGGAQWNAAKGLFVGVAPVWDASIDGSGSGLDADMLDGQHASAFALAGGFSQGSNANGTWERRPNGILEQENVTLATYSETGGPYTFTFPVPFDTAVRGIQLTAINDDNTVNKDCYWQLISWTLTGFTARVNYISSGPNIAELDGLMWSAKGI